MGDGGLKMKLGLTMWDSKTGSQLVINKAYVDYVSEADPSYEPIIITPANNIDQMADLCDGLILPGGIDIDPIFYDEENIASYTTDPARDDFERHVFYAFVQRNKPVFGICRGFQLILREFLKDRKKTYSSYFTFYQHISNHSLATDLSISRCNPSHSVHALRNILYGEEYNKTVRMYVNSMHHQGVIVNFGNSKNTTIKDITVSAMTRYGMNKKETGFIVEAYKINGWSTGGIEAVQWHPEELKDYGLITSFFNDNNAEEENQNALDLNL